eukprot:COSAG01_NODE_26877_length_700_cov_1.520799_2_plen_72_part_00
MYWPETSTLFGTYDASGLGYGCRGAGAFNQSEGSVYLNRCAHRKTYYFMIRTEAVAEIPLRFCSLHLRFLS